MRFAMSCVDGSPGCVRGSHILIDIADHLHLLTHDPRNLQIADSRFRV